MRRLLPTALGYLLAVAVLAAQSPIALDDILQWIGAGSLMPEEIVVRAQQQGLAFPVDDDARKQLNDVGAPPELIDSLAALTGAAEPPPPIEAETNVAVDLNEEEVAALFTDEIVAPAAAPQGGPAGRRGGRKGPRSQGPVSKEQILLALQLGATSDKVEPIVQRRGAGFQLDDPTREQLTSAGAQQPLLDLIAANFKVDLGPGARGRGRRAQTKGIPKADAPLPPGIKVFTPEQAMDYDPYASQGRLDLKMNIDHVTEIRVEGDRVMHRNFMGQPAENDGSTTTQPLPKQTFSEFEVVKKKGRGNYVVMGEPGPKNGYQIRIRVYDPKGGADFYHFQITWKK